MVWDAEGKKISENYESLGQLNGGKKQWADLLLAGKISIAGGGMFASWHRHGLEGQINFKRFKKRWQTWWENIGEKKYGKLVVKARKAFHKLYVLHDGAYVQRSTLETTLADDEIRWLKKEYRNRDKPRREARKGPST